MIDIEALLTMGATAASLGVAIHYLNRLRDSGWSRNPTKQRGAGQPRDAEAMNDVSRIGNSS